jgi:hypothetical protein
MAEAIDLHRQALELFHTRQAEASAALTELSHVEATLDDLQSRLTRLDRSKGATWQPSGARLWAVRSIETAWTRGQRHP